MHLNLKKLVTSMAVGAALVSSWYPANLNAITVPSYITPISSEDIASSGVSGNLPGVGSGSPELTVKAPAAMDIWLAKLAFQESGGKTDLKILDVNGQYSYGCLQFQEGTFRAYALKYGLISKTTKTVDVIYDCNLQKTLAKLMLAEDYSNWRAWYNSSKTSLVGLPPQ